MIPEDDILDRVPRSLVKQNSFIPLFIDDGRLLVACIDQPEHELEDELRLRYDVPVRPVITTLRAINQAITQYYPPGTREVAKEPAPKASSTTKPAAKGKAAAETKKAEKPKATKKIPFDQLSPNEQKDRTQWGYVLMGQAFMLPILIPQIISAVSPRWATQMPSFMVCLAISAVLCGITSFWVTQKYWK
jgi:hypothetical protein